MGEPDKLYYESDVASLAREAMWPAWSAQGGEGGGSPAWLRVWLVDLSVSGGGQVAVLVAAVNQHDTSPTVQYGVAQVRAATTAPPISLSSFCLLPSLSSMLGEGEEPKHYKLVTVGDWAYVYNREGVTMVELTGTEPVENLPSCSWCWTVRRHSPVLLLPPRCCLSFPGQSPVARFLPHHDQHQ